MPKLVEQTVDNVRQCRILINMLTVVETRVNNETVAITETNLFIVEGFADSDCLLVTVAAISDDDKILDFRSTLNLVFQGSIIECNRG